MADAKNDTLKEEPVIIIGAGMAGLSAALQLQEAGIPYIIVDAREEVGGRMSTIQTPTGTHVDLASHWLHADGDGYTPLTALAERFGVKGEVDTVAHVNSYDKAGVAQGTKMRDLFNDGVNWDMAEAVVNSGNDAPLSAFARGKENGLSYFNQVWFAIDGDTPLSTADVVGDRSEAGGMQPYGGMATLLNKMIDGDKEKGVQGVGRDNIRLNTPVAQVDSTQEGVRVTTEDGEVISGSRAIFTGSVDVLKRGIVDFNPPLSDGLQRDIKDMNDAHMGKVVLELDRSFFSEKNISNTHIDLPENNPPVFIHIGPAGEPTVTLYVGGATATRQIENMTADQARDFALKALQPVKELAGFEDHIVGDPIVTQWMKDKYIGAAYSSAPPGVARTGPRNEGNGKLIIAGDTFAEVEGSDKGYSASLAGAHVSGKEAGAMTMRSLHRGKEVTREQDRSAIDIADTFSSATLVSSSAPVPASVAGGKFSSKGTGIGER